MRKNEMVKSIPGFRAVSLSGKDVENGVPFLIRVLVVSVGFLSLASNLALNSAASSSVAAFSSVLLSAYLLVLARKNKGLLIVFGYILLSVYSSCIVNYFGIALFSPYQQWAGTDVAFASVNIVLIFLLSIVVVMPLSAGPYPTGSLVQSGSSGNGVIVGVCVVAFLLCGVFGIGSSYVGSDRQYVNPIYEYSIAFLLIGLYFSGGRKRDIVVFAGVTVVRIVLDFSIGSRVTTIEMVSIWYLMMFASRMRARVLIPLLVGVFVVMLTVGELRGSSFEVSAVSDGIEGFLDAGFAWDGAYAAYHTSESMVAYRDLTVNGADVSGFIEYLVSLIAGGSGGYVGLQYEMEPYFWNMGGGYIPFFFYYYLGYGGVVASSLLIGVLLRSLSLLPDRKNASDMARFVYVWICATCFRWFSYSASPLIRGLLIVAFVFLVLGMLAKNKPVLLAGWRGKRG